MRRALAAVGIHRDDPATWRKERPDHLQHLKSDPVFRAVGSKLTLVAIDEVLGGQSWRRPSDWGAFFLVFPTGRPWNVLLTAGTLMPTTRARCHHPRA